MQTARERNSAVERAAAAVAPPRSLPQLPVQCSRCLRWVDRDRLAVMPIGSSPWCALCCAVDEINGAIRNSRVSLAKEEEALEMLFRAHEILHGR